MNYDFAVTIPAGTTKASPYEQTLKLTKGVIHYLEIGFPGGCRGYAHLILRHREHQLWPTNTQGSFNGERYIIPIREHYKLYVVPYALKAIGWSPDATYDHTITVRVSVLKEEELEPLIGLPGQFTKFFKVLGVKV